MATVSSSWATTPIPVDGVVNAVNWAGAGSMAIPAGYLLVKNDANYLYAALDLVGDNGNDVGTNDYYWFTFDVDGNAGITPLVDTNYSVAPGQPNNVRRQYYKGPGVWTGLLNEVTQSLGRPGFGPSPNSAAPHRIWEFRFPLADIGVDMSSATPQIVRFGVRVSSSNPPFTFDYPAGFYSNFANLHQIVLATAGPYPPGTAGPVMAGVGLIPSAKINADGYATTDPGYFLVVDDVAFGGTMNLISNRVTVNGLWASGARKYRVNHRAGTVGAFLPIDQGWTNYRWVGANVVLESWGPDAEHKYVLADPGLAYGINDLLLQWTSSGFPNGVHQFQAEFYRLDGTVVPTPAQTMTLMVDNNLPLTTIDDIRHDGVSVPPCSIVNLTSATDGVQVVITVNDAQGHLGSWTLTAHFGAGLSASIASGSYPSPHPPNHFWSGVSGLTVPSPGEFTPPTTCAYQFRLSTRSRVTNGYGVFGYTEATRHITLVKPGPAVVPTSLFSDERPLGMEAEDGSVTAGEEPGALGAETFAQGQERRGGETQ